VRGPRKSPRKAFLRYDTLEIDEADLVERLRNGGEVYQHERELLADEREKKQNPKHRPPSIATVLKADLAAFLVFLCEAQDPKLQRKMAVAKVARLQDVCEKTVSKAVGKFDPERVKDIKARFASREWGGYIAAMDEWLADAPLWK
jgi:hypothetical protein